MSVPHDHLGTVGPRRLSDRSLPPYTYLPGRTPHPVRDPRGHLYGQPEGSFETAFEALRRDWRGCESYCYGVDLYNHGYWWEAHESWEPLWLRASIGSALRSGIQSLILVSAAHLQDHLGKSGGVERLLLRAERTVGRAAAISRGALGLELSVWWRESVRPYFGAGRRERYPYLNPL